MGYTICVSVFSVPILVKMLVCREKQRRELLQNMIIFGVETGLMNLNRRLFSVVCILVLSCTLCLSAEAQHTFERWYHTSGDVNSVGIVPTSEPGFMIVYGRDKHFELLRVDGRGDPVWTRSFEELLAPGEVLYPTHIMSVEDSNVVITGQSNQTGAFLMKLSPLGEIVWNFESNEVDLYYRMAIEDLEGDIVVVGSYELGTGGVCCSPVMARFSPNGEKYEDWDPYIDCPTTVGCRLSNIVLDTDGGYLVTGNTPVSGPPRPRLTKVDAEGNMVWSRIYSSVTYGDLYDIAVSGDGGYVVGIEKFPSDTVYIWRLDGDGDMVESRAYKCMQQSSAARLIRTTPTGFIGSIVGGSDGKNASFVKWNEGLDIDWCKEYGGDATEIISQLEVLNNGFVAVGWTESYGDGSRNVFLVRAHGDGNITGIQDGLGSLKLRVFPNPVFSGILNVLWDAPVKNGRIDIFDVLGKKVFTMDVRNERSVSIDILGMREGIYVAQLFAGNDLVAKSRIAVIKEP